MPEPHRSEPYRLAHEAGCQRDLPHSGVCFPEDEPHPSVTPGERYDYAAELARYPHSQIVRLLETAEDLQRDLEASGERWPNVDANAQRLRDELTRRGWRRSYSVWELLEVAPQPCVTVSRADLDAVLAGPGDGSWECSDARARIRTVLADLDRAAQSEVADRG